MASSILTPRLGFRGTQQIQIQCRLQPRRCLTLSSRLQLAAKRSPTQPKPLLKSSPVSSASKAQATRPKTKPSTNGSSKAQPLDVLFKERRVPLIIAGAGVFCVSLYMTMLFISLNKTSSSCTHEHAIPSGLPESLTSTQDPESLRQTAENFDRDLNFPERVTGTRGLRKKLAAKARGHVLEVSIGTGRNLGFYDWTDLTADYAADPDALARRQRHHFEDLLDHLKRQDGPAKKPKHANDDPEMKRIGSLDGEILSFTGLDISPDMLGIARTRVRESVPGLEKIMNKRRREPMPRLVSDESQEVVVDVLDSRVRLFMGDAQHGLPAPAPLSSPATKTPPPQHYDTILQTFGLCSVADPHKLLSNMASVVKPDSGRIILLEHGRGWYDWINERLDQFALGHFKKYGCWWNRDIEGIVREAAKRIPLLEVVGVERPLLTHFGTTLMIELRVRSEGGGTVTGGN